MKILKIAFRNLNSLTGSHELELADGVLGTAGIFAITGPTGAGKSTILDAITLALYGRAARYGRKPNPEDMMSRHTGECSAEVEFEVADGRFRAAWHLNRARKKADGNVQPAKRYLYDANGQTLAEKSRDVDRLVEELIGLDADRFLRSVLLAQNEFAKFLKAQPDERAMLLESLTGTEVYSRLGKLAHETLVDREKLLASREEQIRNIAILEPDKRTQFESEIADGETQSKDLKASVESLRKDIERGDRLTKLLAQQEALASNKEMLDRRTEEFAARYQRLTFHKQASPFREAIHSIDELERSSVTARKSLDDAKGEVRRHTDELRVAFRSGSALTARLDNELVEKTAGLNERRTEREREQKQVTEWIAEHAVDTELAAVVGEIIAAIAGLSSRRTLQLSLVARRDGHLKKRQTLEVSIGKITQQHDDAQKVKAAKDVESQEASHAYNILADGRTIADLDEETERQREQYRRLESLKRELKEHDQHVQDSKAYEATGRIQVTAVADTEESHTQAAARWQQQSELVEVLQESLNRGRLVAGLEEHRTQLKPGETCPLCGSLEHPFVDALPVSASTLQADERKLTAATEERRRLETQRDKAKEHWQARALQLQQTRRQQTELEKTIATKHAEVVATANELAISDPSQAMLDEALDRTTTLGKSLAEKLNQLREAQKGIDLIEKAVMAAAGEVRVCQASLKGEQSGLDSVKKDIEAVDKELAASRTDVAKAEADVRGRLEAFLPADQAVPEPGREDILRETLSERVKAWNEAEKKQRAIGDSLKAIESELKSLDADRAALKVAAERYHQLAAAIPPHSNEARDEAGEAAGDFKAMAAKHESRWKSTKDADHEIEACRTVQEAASVKSAEREKALQRDELKLQNSQEDLVRRLAQTGFEDITALRAALLSSEEATAIEQEQTDLQNDVSENRGKLEKVSEDISDLRQQETSTGEKLAAQREQGTNQALELDELTQQIAQHQVAIQTDDRNRKLVQDRTREVEAEGRALESWRRLKGLIGSADGKRFRLFAQGLSLDVLVRLANRHLSKLSDRYRLQRIAGETLDLEIVDQHQASTRRPMRSLSGGESFIASLALALGLSDLAGRNVKIDSLFIDEGFGSLDPDTLDIAVAALEGLQTSHKTIGVISHVELLKERITAQIRVTPTGGGVSRLTVVG